MVSHSKEREALLLKIPEVAQLLNQSDTTIRRLIEHKRLKSVKIGRSRLVPRHAVEAYMAELERQSA